MAETAPNSPDELAEPPAAPWLTMVTTLLVLLVFGALIFAVFDYYDKKLKPAATEGETELQKLRDSEREILDNFGYDAETKTYRIPIDRAMEDLIQEAKAKGELQTFPVQAKKKK
jgi:hypothetical protein